MTEFERFGSRPKTATAIGRFLPYFRGMVAGGAIVAAAVAVATVMFPDGFRPGDIGGKAAGGALKHEILESIEATVDRDRRHADATAQPGAKAQVDTTVVGAAVQFEASALSGKTGMANVADAACIAANMIVGSTSPAVPPEFRGPNAGLDWYGIGKTIAGATCGLGASFRQQGQESIMAAAQTAAAARGMALTDGSRSPAAQLPRVAQAPASRAKPGPEDLLRVMTISAASRHYDAATVADAEKIALQVPAPIRAKLRDGAAATDDDVFVERVAGLVMLAMRMRD